jgi:multiple sugar transport system permease protein
LILALIVAVFPLFWILQGALQAPIYRFEAPPSILPRGPSIDAIADALVEGHLIRWLTNTFVVATATAILSVAIGLSGAYALSRFRNRGVVLSGVLILTTQLMPPVILMIPLFRIILSLGLANSLTGLIVAYVLFTLPVTTWFLKAIIDSVPIELEEAARIDGCNRFQAAVRVVMPLALPGIVAVGVFAFLEAWGEFLFARTIITSPDIWVGSLGVASFFGEWGADWEQIMATAFIFTLPPVVLFIAFQRYFVAGLGGSLKG